MQFEIIKREGFPFRAEKAALLVIDMQNYFTSSSSHACVPDAPKILPRVKKLIEFFKNTDRPIIFTRHLDVNPNNLLARWWNDRIEESNPLSEINSELDTSVGTILVKDQYDAFLNTNLEKTLRDAGVEQVVITGVISHICCETTARSAFTRNFETFFVTDCTASFDKLHHEATIYNLSHAAVIPVTHEELIICSPSPRSSPQGGEEVKNCKKSSDNGENVEGDSDPLSPLGRGLG